MHFQLSSLNINCIMKSSIQFSRRYNWGNWRHKKILFLYNVRQGEKKRAMRFVIFKWPLDAVWAFFEGTIIKCKAHCIFGSPKIPAFEKKFKSQKSLKSHFVKYKNVNNLIFRAKTRGNFGYFGHQNSRQISDSLLRSKNTLYSTQVPS